MIVATADLGHYAGTVSLVDGGFDPLHPGHVEYFRVAAELGPPVLCNVAPDDWVGRKHPLLLKQAERAELVDAIRWVSLVHPAAGPTVEVLRALRPKYYVKGNDWRGRLPDDELAACADNGVEVVYLDTVRNSSTRLLERFSAALAERSKQ